MEFDQWVKHIDQVIADEGQWIGLADENGWPILDMPELLELSAPKMRLADSSVTAKFLIDEFSPVLGELVASGFDVSEQLEPEVGTRFLVVARRGVRDAYMITHCKVEGSLGPRMLTVHGTDLLGELAFWPAPSVPASWVGVQWRDYVTDASGEKYKKSRRLGWVEMGDVADGYSEVGAAVDVVAKICAESFAAVDAAQGWEVPKFVVAAHDGGGPRVVVRLTDDFLWDTIAEVARVSGVNVGVDLWWPSDGSLEVLKVDFGVDDSRRIGRRVFTPKVPVLVVRVGLAREVV